MIFLRSVELRFLESRPEIFPYTVPFVKSFETWDFTKEVTFLAGENGSGKSTFLEMLACAIGSITVGSQPVRTDPTLVPLREFSDHLKLTWSRKTHHGFFMRAEDFFGYAKKMAETREDLEQDLAETERDYRERSKMAQDLARLPYRRELSAMQNNYGEGLDQNSHGEGFIKLFRERFTGPGLYLLDEPETPLSPTRQLTLLAMLKAMVDQDAQFIIASHSPILMAYPGAQIIGFDGGKMHEESYDTLEHVVVTRSFLNNPEQYLHYLMK